MDSYESSDYFERETDDSSIEDICISCGRHWCEWKTRVKAALDSCVSSDDFRNELNSISVLGGGELDLHLAAELGKTLLDRNRELESLLKEKQSTIEDQKLEIEYLTKQTVALKEANDSRLRIYEQLEVSIQDLERSNHRLMFENGSEKKHVKNLNTTIEQLEAKNEELQGTIDDLRLQVDVLKKKVTRNSDIASPKSANQKEAVKLKHLQGKYESEEDIRTASNCLQSEQVKPVSSPNFRLPQSAIIQTLAESEQNASDELDSGIEEMAQILAQLRESRAQCSKDERIIAELEEQLATMVQQNQALENQVIHLSHKGDDLNMKSMHEELTTLDEVRQGQMCCKCLRTMDQSSELDLAEEDDQSMLDALNASTYRSSFAMNIQDNPDQLTQSSPIPSPPHANPYKVLVEKYEALVEVHRGNPVKKLDQCPSLQEEMQMSGEFTTSTKDTDEESGHGESLRTSKQHKQSRKTFSTPTDFSEAETSSSGFADDTCNKGTQTEGRVGSFLCTIVDGEDCKFSIYDDASPIDSRFRDRPEYRDLFKEIFSVLKKAAENKAEGEELPLLDDHSVPQEAPMVPPATPMNEQLPEFPDDDTQSVVSSTMSELSTQNEATNIIENIIQAQNQPIPDVEPSSAGTEPTMQECVLRPLVRQPLEYISMEVRKRSSSRRKNKYSDRSDSPVTHIIGSPKITFSNRPNSGRRRRQNAPSDENAWNGNTLQFWATRNIPSPTPSQGSGKGYIEFKPSPASQDLHKLKKLDMSYAEVLRNADNKKRELYRQRRK